MTNHPFFHQLYYSSIYPRRVEGKLRANGSPPSGLRPTAMGRRSLQLKGGGRTPFARWHALPDRMHAMCTAFMTCLLLCGRLWWFFSTLIILLFLKILAFFRFCFRWCYFDSFHFLTFSALFFAYFHIPFLFWRIYISRVFLSPQFSNFCHIIDFARFKVWERGSGLFCVGRGSAICIFTLMHSVFDYGGDMIFIGMNVFERDD